MLIIMQSNNPRIINMMLAACSASQYGSHNIYSREKEHIKIAELYGIDIEFSMANNGYMPSRLKSDLKYKCCYSSGGSIFTNIELERYINFTLIALIFDDLVSGFANRGCIGLLNLTEREATKCYKKNSVEIKRGSPFYIPRLNGNDVGQAFVNRQQFDTQPH